MLDKKNMIDTIIESLKKEKILNFIIYEVEDSLDYLNKYKIKNILDNLNDFVKEVKTLNENYIESL